MLTVASYMSSFIINVYFYRCGIITALCILKLYFCAHLSSFILAFFPLHGNCKNISFD